MKIFESLEKRYSSYGLERTSALSNDEVLKLIQDAVRLTPSAFNAQTQRVVVLFDEASDQLWDLTREALRAVAPEEGFERTVAKLESFKAQGTILFYSHTPTVTKLQEDFALYADNFPVWAEQENGMLQLVIWSALSENGIGGSLQHYNPVIDDHVAKAFNIDPKWTLRAQMPFGGATDAKHEKDALPLEERILVR